MGGAPEKNRASHRNRKHTAIWVFYMGTHTVPFGPAVYYLTAITNTDVYRIDPVNLLPYYGIYGTIRVEFIYLFSLNFYERFFPRDISNLPWIC